MLKLEEKIPPQYKTLKTIHFENTNLKIKPHFSQMKHQNMQRNTIK